MSNRKYYRCHDDRIMTDVAVPASRWAICDFCFIYVVYHEKDFILILFICTYIL